VPTPLKQWQDGRLGAREVCVNRTYLSKLKKVCPASDAGEARDARTAPNKAVRRRVGGHSSGSPALRYP
jgi:hypothetical protein